MTVERPHRRAVPAFDIVTTCAVLDGEPLYDLQFLFVGVYAQKMSSDGCILVVRFCVMTESSGIVCVPMRLFAFGWSIIEIVDNFLEALAHLLPDPLPFFVGRFVLYYTCYCAPV